MSPSRALFTSLSVDWATPKSLYQALDEEFHFTLDPCPLRADGSGEGRGGLNIPWRGDRVYCNPPYNREIGKWLRKAREAALAVYLLPARTDTIWFHDYALLADEIRFLRGRLRFNDGVGRATFPSMVVIYRPLIQGPAFHFCKTIGENLIGPPSTCEFCAKPAQLPDNPTPEHA